MTLAETLERFSLGYRADDNTVSDGRNVIHWNRADRAEVIGRFTAQEAWELLREMFPFDFALEPSRLSLKKHIASEICAQEGFAPEDENVWTEGEPAYFHYLPHAERILANVLSRPA